MLVESSTKFSQKESNSAKTVLIIEDEIFLREVLRDKLIYMGFQVLEASNGSEGYKIALKYKPDLILLDIIMPVMDGMSMLKKLCSDHWGINVPIIVMTNVSDMDAIVEISNHKIKEIKTIQKNARQLKNGFDIKIYLEARFGNNLCDYIIKTDYSLDELVNKIQKAFI